MVSSVAENKNKAGYTVIEVACGWAGAHLRSSDYLGKSSEVKEIKCDGANRPTDRPIDGQKRVVESRARD